jgi:hypothetical protein
MVIDDSNRAEEEPREGDDAVELLPLRQRLGLWCATFPGCGALLLGSLVLCGVIVLRLLHRDPARSSGA